MIEYLIVILLVIVLAHVVAILRHVKVTSVIVDRDFDERKRYVHKVIEEVYKDVEKLHQAKRIDTLTARRAQSDALAKLNPLLDEQLFNVVETVEAEEEEIRDITAPVGDVESEETLARERNHNGRFRKPIKEVLDEIYNEEGDENATKEKRNRRSSRDERARAD